MATVAKWGLVFTGLLEWVSLAKIMKNQEPVGDMFGDALSQKSESFRRLFYFFVAVLGASRWALLVDEKPSKGLYGLVFLIHMFENGFFYSEAMNQEKPLPIEKKAFLAILWAVPSMIIVRAHSLPTSTT